MLQPIYITHTTAISPLSTEESILQPAIISNGQKSFKCVEPDYSTAIPPMQLRRMSRLLKMGIYSGLECLKESGIEMPDGIITGTGKGSMVDTEKFVKELKQYNEEALNPTPFIMSTYNAVNGAIALQTKATGYNQTFVHRGSSLELSLYDAQLKLNEAKTTEHILVGCFDEMTDEYIFIKDKTYYWKKDWNISAPLHTQNSSKGSVGGEGAAFFMVSNQPTKDSLKIERIYTAHKLQPENIAEIVASNLSQINWNWQDVDMVVLGINGDSEDEKYYDTLRQYIPDDLPVMTFKNLCGEYETASGFGLWLTFQHCAGKALPDIAWLRDSPKKSVKNILFYNHYRGINHNLMLLSIVN